MIVKNPRNKSCVQKGKEGLLTEVLGYYSGGLCVKYEPIVKKMKSLWRTKSDLSTVTLPSRICFEILFRKTHVRKDAMRIADPGRILRPHAAARHILLLELQRRAVGDRGGISAASRSGLPSALSHSC